MKLIDKRGLPKTRRRKDRWSAIGQRRQRGWIDHVVRHCYYVKNIMEGKKEVKVP